MTDHHSGRSNSLPSGWEEQVARAYTTFGTVPSFDEFGIRKWLEHLHPRDKEGKWREVIGRLFPKEQEQRGTLDRPDLDEIDLDFDEEGDALDIPEKSPYRLKEINPGLAKGVSIVKTPRDGKMVGAKNVRGQPFNRVVVKPGPNRPPEPGKPWENNGADLRTLPPETVNNMIRKVSDEMSENPQFAKKLEELTLSKGRDLTDKEISEVVMAELIGNITDAFESASKGEMEYGKEWYERAGRAALDLAKRYDADPHLVAALMAATSPRTQWEHNLAAVEVALASLLPDKSPVVNEGFLRTKMAPDEVKTDENGNVVEVVPGMSARQYIVENKAVRESYGKKHPRGARLGPWINPETGEEEPYINPKTGKEDKWIPTEPEDEYEARITKAIEDDLDLRNEDGTELQLYQYRDQALRAALMDVNNRVLAKSLSEKYGLPYKEGMGIQVPLISSDGVEMKNRYQSFAKILQTNMSAIDRLFGYDDLDPYQAALPKGWNRLPTSDEEMHDRIDRTLGGHKTRSFYDDIITLGKSDAATIDMHALRAAMFGKGAALSEVGLGELDKLLGEKKVGGHVGVDPEEKRIGAYAVFNEAFRRATEQINAGRPEGDKLTVPQVQAVAWIASRPESIAGALSHIAVQQRDPDRRNARVLPFVPQEQRSQAMQHILASQSLVTARQRFESMGIDSSQLTPEVYNRAKASLRPMTKEFEQLKQEGTTNLSLAQLTTMAWLLNTFGGDDADIAQRAARMFGSSKSDAKITPADVALVRDILGDRFSANELVEGKAESDIQHLLERYNADRQASGVVGKDIDYEAFKEFLRAGGYA